MIDLRAPVRLTLFGKIILLVIGSSIVPMFIAVLIWMWTYYHWSWTVLSAFFVLTVIILVAAYLLASHLTRPIRALMVGVERIAKGDFSPVNSPNTHDELQDLSIAF